MLSPQTLDRCSAAYRRGYLDGHQLRRDATYDAAAGTFAAHDYVAGLEAGLNDRYWADAPLAARYAPADERMARRAEWMAANRWWEPDAVGRKLPLVEGAP